MSLPTYAYPGLPLGSSTTYLPGPGTYLHNSQIIASLSGQPTLTPPSSSSSTTTTTTLPLLSILRPPTSNAPHLPTLNSIVLGLVTRLTKDRITLRLVASDNHILPVSANPPVTGIIRREDVRGWEIDGVVVAEQFRVGDVVRAAVISLGDQAAYYLTTARNELGVLMAREGAGGGVEEMGGGGGEGGEEVGEWMVPVSWKEFKARSGRREGRKVARPV